MSEHDQQRFAEIRHRLERATPGPWDDLEAFLQAAANADFITCSREDIDWLTEQLQDARSLAAARGAEVAVLRAALEKARIAHLYVDDDPYYSCELRGGANVSEDIAECSCDADRHNAAIARALGVGGGEDTGGEHGG